MYVIFPADDLIRMTYGVAVPRFKPRPTLDNLREPAVPFGPRPYSLPTQPVNNNALISKPPAPKRPPSEPSAQLPSLSRATTPLRAATPVRATTPSRSATPIRAATPLRSTTPVPNGSIRSLTLNTPPTTPKINVQTDAFGYNSTVIDDRSNHPNIFVEPPTPSVLSESSTAQLPRITPSSPIPNAKSKHKIHLHLGRLGRSKTASKPEPARLRDVTDIRISNPTFTRENLQQRNYDAFFESGEPVYSLEQRVHHVPDLEPEHEVVVAESRPRSLGIFNRRSKAPAEYISGNSSTTSALRSRSVDRNNGSEMSQKALNSTPPLLETDEFGYSPTPSDLEPEPDDIATPGTSRVLTADDLYTGAYYPKAKNRPPGSEPSIPNSATKPKRKLHLHLGRLGKSSGTTKPEPARLRDVTDIRITNPTFTRENLQQRNYDAFFESGVPVYSLERRMTPPVSDF